MVKAGDNVKVHYKGTLTDGTMFDSSEGRDPLEFTVGAGMMIKGFDNAVLGMEVGQSKTVEISSEDAYGAANPDMVMTFPLADFPEGMNPTAGMTIGLSDNMGNNIPATILEVKEDSVVIDANSPLAGKDLVFEIELVSIG